MPGKLGCCVPVEHLQGLHEFSASSAAAGERRLRKAMPMGGIALSPSLDTPSKKFVIFVISMPIPSVPSPNVRRELQSCELRSCGVLRFLAQVDR